MSGTNLLKDPLLSVEYNDGSRGRVSLPELFGSLTRTAQSQSEKSDLEGSLGPTITGFSKVAAHQRQTFYRFLVQVGTIALNKSGHMYKDIFPTEDADWEKILRSLTSDFQNDEPWTLFVENISLPAFMQPAIGLKTGLTEFKRDILTPDALDMIITSKMHDVKPARSMPTDAELWLHALISLQTMQGFLGVGNQGVSRMNGGFGSRCFIARTPSLNLAARLHRDLRMSLFHRDTIVEEYSYQALNGLSLLWTQPWDKDTQIDARNLDPYFIEICRRIRIVKHPKGGASDSEDRNNDSNFIAKFRISKQPLINAKERKGDLGDPFVPVTADGTALTLSGNGFTTQVKTDILFQQGTISRSPRSLSPVPGIDNQFTSFFVGSVLVRGQGKTEGLHEFVLPIPSTVKHLLDTDSAAILGEESKKMLADADLMRLRILRPALLALLQGGSDELNFKDNQDISFRNRFTEMVDDIFFDHLWRRANPDADETYERACQYAWVMALRHTGESVLRQAVNSLPSPVARRLKAEAVAEARLHHGFNKTFEDSLKYKSYYEATQQLWN